MNNLDKIIDNDIIIITLDNAKDSVIKYINSKDKLYNIKVYSKSELLKNIYFFLQTSLYAIIYST